MLKLRDAHAAHSTSLFFDANCASILDTAQLERLMKDFALHYRNAPAVSSFVPKAGELVAVSVLARFTNFDIGRDTPVTRSGEVLG